MTDQLLPSWDHFIWDRALVQEEIQVSIIFAISLNQMFKKLGGACWSARGLIGINYGFTCMQEFGLTKLAISEAATYSPKNILSPVLFIEQSLMVGVEFALK